MSRRRPLGCLRVRSIIQPSMRHPRCVRRGSTRMCCGRGVWRVDPRLHLGSGKDDRSAAIPYPVMPDPDPASSATDKAGVNRWTPHQVRGDCGGTLRPFLSCHVCARHEHLVSRRRPWGVEGAEYHPTLNASSPVRAPGIHSHVLRTRGLASGSSPALGLRQG